MQGALLALVATLLLASGCLSAPPRLRWDRAPGHVPLPYRLHVQPLKDVRPSTMDHLRDLAYIPLVPFAPTTFHRPGARLGFPDPSREIPLAVADVLVEAAVFRSVDSSSLGEDALRYGTAAAGTDAAGTGGADFVLEGKLRAGRVHMRFITYGISFASTGLWIVGWPMRRISLEIDAVFRLVDVSTGERIWTYHMNETWGQWQGMFYGRNFYHFPQLTERAARRMVLSLDAAIGRGLLRETG